MIDFRVLGPRLVDEISLGLCFDESFSEKLGGSQTNAF
jgi:hypothetical protein